MKVKKGRPNWKSRTIWTKDNLVIMRQMNRASVDFIYLDPPFNSKHNYAAPIGSAAEGAEFTDIFHLDDIRIHWIDEIKYKNPRVFRVVQAATTDSCKAYLAYMAPRLMEMQRILNDQGSICLHCDPAMGHYLKALMDAIFGKKNFRNEIVWCYSKWTNSANSFQKNHDLIFWYSKSEDFSFRRLYRMTARKQQQLDKGWGTNTANGMKQFLVYDRAKAADRIEEYKERGYTVVYCDDKDEGVLFSDWWHDIAPLNSQAKERTGYPTQKPLKLINRLLEALTKNGHVVFDPFCGCATTLVAADRLGLNWMGIDMSPKAAELVVERIKKDQRPLLEKIIHRTDNLRRTDLGKIPKYNCQENKDILYGRQDGLCNGCFHRFPKRNLTFDHIVPRSDGGDDHIDNLQLLCAACNSKKGVRGMEYLAEALKMDENWQERSGSDNPDE